MIRQHAKSLSTNTLFISLIVIILVAGAGYYFMNKAPGDSAARIVFDDEKIYVSNSEVQEMLNAATEQNVVLNRSYVIEQLAQIKVLEAQAKKLNIVPSDEQVDAVVKTQIATLESQGLDEALSKQNMTKDAFIVDFTKNVARDMLLRAIFNAEVVSKVQVTAEQLKQVYTANPSQFVIPESVLVKHILICYEDATGCTANYTKSSASKAISQIYQALQNNVSFEALAAEYSTDSASASAGGDLGRVLKGQTVPQFEKVAFETTVGSISKSFESPYGYHILVVYGKQAAQQMSLEQVAPQIRNQLVLSQAGLLQQAYVSGLMASASVIELN